MTPEKLAFSFGKNWQEFINKYFTEERLSISKEHLFGFLKLPNLNGKYFLDIGCGSGLQSLSALLAGAEKIVSFDVDPYSVKTTQEIKKRYGNSKNWDVLQGSILDTDFISQLPPADIVYSWGVLHHTGNMWQAIKNAAGLMKDNGMLYIAIYTTDGKSNYWLEIKKKYNRVGPIQKRFMEFSYICRDLIIPNLLKLKNPLKTLREYKRSRGMEYFTAVKDWLGGYPYEFAKPEEVIFFCKNHLSLELINLKTGEANTEYLFKK